MSALIFPTDCKVGYKNNTEATWHGYDVELPEGVMPSEAVRFVGADYPVNVLKASMGATPGEENKANHEDLSLAGPSIFLVTTPMPDLSTDLDAPQAPDNYDPREMPSFSGDTLVLGVCSQDYRVISNMEIAEVADRFVCAADEYLREHEENPDPSIELTLPAVDSVGTLRGRRVFFLSLLLGGFGLAFKALPTVSVDLGGNENEEPLYEETGFEDFRYKVRIYGMKLSAADGDEHEIVDVELHFSADKEAGLEYRITAILDDGGEGEEGTLLDNGTLMERVSGTGGPTWALMPDLERGEEETAPFTVESYQDMDEAVTAALREILGVGEDKTGGEKETALPVYELDLPELTRHDGDVISGCILVFDAESYTVTNSEKQVIDSGSIEIDVTLDPAVTLLPQREPGDVASPDLLNDESYSYLDKIVDETLRKKEEPAEESAEESTSPEEGKLDDIEARLLFVSSHDGSRPLSVKVVFTRVVCNNTLTAAELDPKVARLFTIKHLGDTKAKLESMAGAMEYLVKTTGDFKQRLMDYSSFLLSDEEADLLAGYFFGFSWKLTWLREAASRLWRGEGLLGAESIQAPSLYRLYNVVTQILSHEQQGGADADEAEQAGAAFSSSILDKYKGNRSPAEASAYMARIFAGKDKVLEEARQAAQVAEKKNKEGVEKMSAAKAGKEV